MATVKTRVNFYATDRIISIIEKYTEDLGMNQGAFISLCISEYAKNDDMLNNMKTIQQTITDLQNLGESVKKENK